MSKHWYVGLTRQGRKRVAFQSTSTPTERTHGKKFVYAIGPFRTKRGAFCMAKYGAHDNPHLQTVSEAEKAAKTWCK